MSKIYIASSAFLMGTSISGLISYSSLIIPKLRQWSISLALLAFLIFCLILVCDDYIIEKLVITQKAFIFCLIGVALSLVFGVLIQWQN